MNRTTFFVLGLITLIGFSAIGGIIMELFLDVRFLSIFNTPWSWYEQIAFGLLYGLFTAIIGWEIVKLKFLSSTRRFFGDLIKNLNLGFWDIAFISFCAGTGEEILFRGAIQPYLGIWITAILFVAIHGYLNPWDWKISVYGLYMCFVIGGIGIMCNKLGITSSIAAHFAIDLYLLLALNKSNGSSIFISEKE